MISEASLPKADKRLGPRARGSRRDPAEFFYAPLPAACVAKLDAEGKVRGKTWRDMRVNCTVGGGLGGRVLCEPLQAIRWFWWKRGLPACFTDWMVNPRTRAARAAELAMKSDAGGGS